MSHAGQADATSGRAEAVPVRCMGRSVPVASAEDMVLFKIVAWRLQDAANALSMVARHTIVSISRT